MKKVYNPVIKGFSPDPAVIRVKSDYYIATSTFQWSPSIRIYHSRDLVNWNVVPSLLNNVKQLDLKGIPDSCGIFAPCLSYSNGEFYIVYTVVKNIKGYFGDMDNYLISAKNIEGPWSEPVYLHSCGFDPSLFHDEDGKKWLLSLNWDYRKSLPADGIIMQEYSQKDKKTVGKIFKIFDGTDLSFTEGPHIYKKDDYYYLMTAEGGTGYEHAITMSRSKNIMGPYEVDPCNPILTSKDDSHNYLQKAGHGCLFTTDTGEWLLSHLASRPNNKKSILGRETCIQNVKWTKDGWLRMTDGTSNPKDFFWLDTDVISSKELPQKKYLFDKEISKDFMTLREPVNEDVYNLSDRAGYLRLRGRESLSSIYEQSLIALRVTDKSFTSTIAIEFNPETYRHLGGLVCYYDTFNYCYLAMSCDDDHKKIIEIIKNEKNDVDILDRQELDYAENQCMYLKVIMNQCKGQFYYSYDSENWTKVGEKLDLSYLSDEECNLDGFDGFTGMTVGVCCQDMQNKKIYMDVKWMTYEESSN